MDLLRQRLLAGRRIALAGAVAEPLTEALRELGAELVPLPPAALADDEERVGEWARARVPLHALVYCAGADQRSDATWAAVREVALGALIPAGAGAAGKIVLIAPPPGGQVASMLRAALENLARTLSVEWARYGLTAVMIAPAASTTDQHLAELVSFLVSEAGDYISGCRLELGAVS